jgi:hypothetical protein
MTLLYACICEKYYCASFRLELMLSVAWNVFIFNVDMLTKALQYLHVTVLKGIQIMYVLFAKGNLEFY